MSRDESSSKELSEMLTCDVDSPLFALSVASLNSQYYPDEVHELFIGLGARPINGSHNHFMIDGAQVFISDLSELEETDPETFGILYLHQVRYDIIEDRLLVIRMPDSVFHSEVVTGLSSAIVKGISELRALYSPDSDTFNVLNKVCAIRRADIYYRNALTTPDIQLKVRSVPDSPVVVEFQFSRTYGSMGGLARVLHNHIVGSEGETKVAIGLEWHNGQIRLSVWVPKIVAPNRLERNIILHRQLVTEESKDTLDIYVKDLVAPEYRAARFPSIDPSAKISIRHADIIDIVDKAWVLYEEIINEVKLKKSRKPVQMEKQAFLEPPDLLASDINNDAPRRYFGRHPRSYGSRPGDKKLFSTIARPTSGSYQPSLRFVARAGTSGSILLPAISRSLPWIRRLIR